MSVELYTLTSTVVEKDEYDKFVEKSIPTSKLQTNA